MELDPLGTEVETAPCLLEWAVREVEPHVGHEPSLRAFRVGERAIVRNGEGRLAVVLVHTEDVRAGEAEAVEQPQQLVVFAGHPVDVVPEMRVRVVQERVLGQLGAQGFAIPVDDRPSALERGHRLSLRACFGAAERRPDARRRHQAAGAAAAPSQRRRRSRWRPERRRPEPHRFLWPRRGRPERAPPR